MEMGMVLIHASIGVSMDACGAGLPPPMCRQMVMSSSTTALKSGSQYGLWMLGKPWIVGFSLIEIAVQPLRETRFSSSTINFGSQHGSIAQGMKRPGFEPHHSSMCQSL